MLLYKQTPLNFKSDWTQTGINCLCLCAAGGPPILEFLGQPINRAASSSGAAAPVGDYQMRAVIRPPQQYVPYSSYQPRGQHGGGSSSFPKHSWSRPGEDEAKGLYQAIKVCSLLPDAIPVLWTDRMD